MAQSAAEPVITSVRELGEETAAFESARHTPAPMEPRTAVDSPAAGVRWPLLPTVATTHAFAA